MHIHTYTHTHTHTYIYIYINKTNLYISYRGTVSYYETWKNLKITIERIMPHQIRAIAITLIKPGNRCLSLFDETLEAQKQR